MRIIIEVRDVTVGMIGGCREAGAEQKFKDISNAYEVGGGEWGVARASSVKTL